MSDIFLKCPPECNATVSHSSKKGHTWVSTWHWALTCARCQVLSKVWTRCAWTWPEVAAPGGVGATTYRYRTRYHPARTLAEAQLQAPGRFIVSLVDFDNWWMFTLTATCAQDFLGIWWHWKQKRVKSRLGGLVKATLPCLGCFWHSVVGTWWHFRSGTWVRSVQKCFLRLKPFFGTCVHFCV